MDSIKHSRCNLVYLLVLFSFPGCADRPDAEVNESAPIHGKWNGMKAEDRDHSGELPSLWDFGDGEVTEHIKDIEDRMTYSIDTSRQPHEIDLTFQSGPYAGRTTRGIFRVENDRLCICYIKISVDGISGRARPSVFDVTKRDDVVMLTFERAN